MLKLFLRFGGKKNPKQIIAFLANPLSLLEIALTGRMALEPEFPYGLWFNSLKHIKPKTLYHFLPAQSLRLLSL